MQNVIRLPQWTRRPDANADDGARYRYHALMPDAVNDATTADLRRQ